MTFLHPSAFYLLLISLLILLLYFLRARERQREVSALFLWEGLPGDPQSRAAQIRQQIDPLLLLQWAALLALVVALAEPVWRMRTTSVSGLALILDGSASMRTITEDGSSRYEQAVREAQALLGELPGAAVAMIQLSSRPAILASPEVDRTAAIDALQQSSATWYGDGSVDTLQSLLGSLGGASRFERVVLFSDHVIADAPTSFETRLFAGGENLALTGFSVRENPAAQGVTALVSVLNDSDAYQDVTVRIDDRENQTTLTLLMAPGSAEQYVIPFPNSRGTLFSAALEPEDAYPVDNRRFFALDRPIDIRVHWIGSENRYLLAALRSVAPVTWVDDPTDADLTVVHDAQAPAPLAGTVLLVHSGLGGVFTVGEPRSVEGIDVRLPDHPLLRGVDPSNFRIREAPSATLPEGASIVLASGDIPLLAQLDGTSRVVYLAPDLLETNLPITIDFPLLVRNIAADLVSVPSKLAYRSGDVGEPISLTGRGAIMALYDAGEEAIPLPVGTTTYRPSSPGFHTLLTDRGAFAIAVNVPPAESAPAPADSGEQAASEAIGHQAVRLLNLWPVAAGLAVLLLLAEAALHSGRRSLLRRAR